MSEGPYPARLGVCYYPEHWPEATWAEDAARMKGVGLHWVRIGEFAWSLLEPDPGRFDWGWMDRAIDGLGTAGLKVVLGTPTATPPKLQRAIALTTIYPIGLWSSNRGASLWIPESRRRFPVTSMPFLPCCWSTTTSSTS